MTQLHSFRSFVYEITRLFDLLGLVRKPPKCTFQHTKSACCKRRFRDRHSGLLNWRDSWAQTTGMIFHHHSDELKRAEEGAFVWPSIINERIKSKTLSDTDREAL